MMNLDLVPVKEKGKKKKEKGKKNDNRPWNEKYRPKDLADVVGHHEVIQSVLDYIARRNIPHLLFHGPAGTGKTTTATII